MQLTVINTHDSKWLYLLNDDPVRPHIPEVRRIAHNKEIFLLHDDNTPRAVMCCAYLGNVATTEEDLDLLSGKYDIATLYTVWSYGKGAGREIVEHAVNYMKTFKPFVRRVITLSPPTRMAERFHLSNGANLLQRNQLTVNFEYPYP